MKVGLNYKRLGTKYLGFKLQVQALETVLQVFEYANTILVSIPMGGARDSRPGLSNRSSTRHVFGGP